MITRLDLIQMYVTTMFAGCHKGGPAVIALGRNLAGYLGYPEPERYKTFEELIAPAILEMELSALHAGVEWHAPKKVEKP